MKANAHQLTEFVNYSGLYRDKNIANENYIFCETIANRSKAFDWEVAAHFHGSLYQLFFAESGCTTLFTSGGQIKLEAPFMVFVPPLSIHGFDFSEGIVGRILTFSDFYIQSLLEKYTEILGSLDEIFWIGNEDFQPVLDEFTGTFNKIDNEFASKNEDKGIMLEYMLYLLVLQCYRYSNRQITRDSQMNTSLSYSRKFQHLIKTSNSPFTSLQEYADRLHITTKHLNKICRLTKEMSSLQVIQAEVILKAKAHLSHLSSNVSEIAYELGFDDPSYFTRLFKKHTGLTPNEYRKKYSHTKLN